MRRALASFACVLVSLASAAEEIERDDPAERMRAMRQWRGDLTPSERWQILREAARERDRYGIGAARQRQRMLAPVGTGAFFNVGPTSADYEFNAGRYFEVDSGRARQIVAHPTDPGILYLSTAGGGVWKSWDAGDSWEPITDALGTTAVGTLAMDPSNPDILYLGFGDPFDVHQPGLVKSTDGGATWSDPVLLGKASTVTDLKVDPLDSSLVFATTNAGLFRSTDAGASWMQVSLVGAQPTDTSFFMWNLAWVGDRTWLATGQLASSAGATGTGTRLGLWRSTDGGATWAWNTAALPGGDRLAAQGGRASFAVAASTLVDPVTARVFMLAATAHGDATLDLYRSEDGGQSFVAMGLNDTGAPDNPNIDLPTLDVLHGQAWYNQAIAVDPTDPDVVFVGGDVAVVRSIDGGATWSAISDWLPGPSGIALPYIHADLHAFAVAADGTVYAGSDGGIFASPDARSGQPSAVTFTSSHNRGLVTHLVYTAACAPESWPDSMQGWVGGGLQDNGTRVRVGGSSVFNQILGGDGIGLAVSGTTHVDARSGDLVPDVLLASAEFRIFRTLDGGRSWVEFENGMGSSQLVFFVRLERDLAAQDAQTFVTFTGQPAAVYRSSAYGYWSEISGYLRWQDSDGYMTTGFVAPNGGTIGLRNLTTHRNRAGMYGVVSNKYAYVTADGGEHWLVSLQPAPPDAAPGVGAYLLSSMAFDPLDLSGKTFYLTSKAMALADANGNLVEMPRSFGHLYKTTDGGLHFTSLGTQDVSQGGLPFVPFDVVKVDPGDNRVLYVGTELGLYRSVDSGLTFARFGGASLPLVEVTDLCISPASRRLTASTYGRGFWQISTDSGSNAAGVRGNGDTNFDQRIDGLDLIDLADAFGTTQATPLYRWQADLVGTVNAIDAADVAALLSRFGGAP